MPAKKYIQSIERAGAVLNCFSERKTQLKLVEIAQQLGLGKSTVHGIVDTLTHLSLLDQDPVTSQYRLGTANIRYGELAKASIDVIAIARPQLEWLCDQVNETVHLAQLSGQEVVYIDKVETSQSMRIATARGSRNPAFCTGVGKAMLAYVPEADLEPLFASERPARTAQTITERGALLDEFARIRRQGYATDRDEIEVGLSCLAIPIREHDGTVRYAMSISGPSVRMTEARVPQLLERLRYAVRQVEKQLGVTA